MAVLIDKYIDQCFPLRVKPIIIKTSSSSMIFEFAWNIVNNHLNYLHLESTSCSRYQFQCKNKKCIRRGNICNLRDDCGDNSDENFCGMFD